MKHTEKRLLSLLLAAALALSLCMPAWAQGAQATFSDVPADHWAYAYIEEVYEKGFMNGVGGGKFDPDSPVQRCMFVTILSRMEGIDSTLYTDSPFTDVDSQSWYGPAVAWASQNKIVEGYNSVQFAPFDLITREQVCVILERYARTMGYNLGEIAADVVFTDAGEISPWAADAVGKVQKAGITSQSGTLVPQEYCTRAEAAKMIALASARMEMFHRSRSLCYVASAENGTAKVYVDGQPGEYTVTNYDPAFSYGGVMEYKLMDGHSIQLFNQVTPNKTIRYLATQAEADALNQSIIDSGTGATGNNNKYWAFGAFDALRFQANTLYVNGTPRAMADGLACYLIQNSSAVKLDAIANANNQLDYKYAAVETNQDDEVTAIYYSTEDLSFDGTQLTVSDNSNPYLAEMTVQREMDAQYEAFIDGRIYVDGMANTYEPVDLRDVPLHIVIGKDEDETSAVYVKNYGEVNLGAFQIESYSKSNYPKMSYEMNLDGANTEVSMQWGHNAVLYSMGGTMTAGDKDVRSYMYAEGDNSNGIFAGTGGKYAGLEGYESYPTTSKIFVTNSDFRLTGWNAHVADTVYGGYVSLDQVRGVTGTPGYAAVGQATAVANDFGSGVVEAKNSDFQIWGNRSAGAYPIGAGKIILDQCKLDVYLTGALVSSGGYFYVKDTEATGVMAVRVRGGTSSRDFEISNSDLTAAVRLEGEYTDILTGETSTYAYKGGYNMTEDEIAAYATKSIMPWDMSAVDNPYEGTLYDNLFYNHSTGEYIANDYTTVPYLTPGMIGGLVASVITYDNAAQELKAVNNTYTNLQGEDYNYLLASQNGASAVVNFIDTDETIKGIIWNQGQKGTEGPAARQSSSVDVHFVNSSFEGSFADGDNGLWDGPVEYKNSAGELTRKNGNYLGSIANGQVSASFDKDSRWVVTHDSYLGKLVISEGAEISAPEGKTLTMTVDGVKTELKPGTYEGAIIITVKDGTPSGGTVPASQASVTVSILGSEGSGTVLCGSSKVQGAGGTLQVPSNGPFTVEFQPDDGCGVAIVILNGSLDRDFYVEPMDQGVILGAPDSYTFSSAEGVTSIAVAFASSYPERAWTISGADEAAKTASIITGQTVEDREFMMIPSSINGYTITALDTNATMRMATGMIWTIPSTVKAIKTGAFADNTTCIYYIIPQSVTTVEAGFDGGGNQNATYVFPASLRNVPAVRDYANTTPDRILFYN